MNAQPKNQKNDEVFSVPLDRQTDNELLVLYVDRHSEAAFNELVSRHSTMVLNVCLACVSDRSRADDAFQATFLALLQNSRRLRSSTSLAGWLYRVAQRAAIKASKMQRLESNQVDPVEPAIEIDPLHRLATREVIQTLVSELNAIPGRYREPITLFYFEQLSRSEIAARMDCSVATVKSLLQRGKRLLKNRLLRNGIVPSMVLLSLQATTQSVAAASISQLVETTVATCAATVSASASLPTHLTFLSKRAEWSMFTSNSLVFKSAWIAFGIAVIVAMPLLIMADCPPKFESPIEINQAVLNTALDDSSGSAEGQDEVRVISTQIQQKGSDQDKKRAATSEKKQKKLAYQLLDGDLKKLQKFAATPAGQKALIEIYVEKCLEADPLTKSVFEADSRTRNLVYMEPDGKLVSVISTIDVGGGANIENERVSNPKARKILTKIQQELGRAKAENICISKYPDVAFHISQLSGGDDKKAASYAIMIESSKQKKK